jgi:hypothetical protein
MTTETQANDAATAAPVLSDDVNPELNTPVGTAPGGEVDETKQAEPVKTFTQAEVDAMVQKRLLKEERRVHRRVEQQLREQSEAKTREIAPQRDEFRDDDAYLQAQIEHLAEKKAAEKLEQRRQATEAEERNESFISKAEKVAERYPDFQQVVGNPALRINDGMAEFVSDSEQGAELAYFLGKNPARAADIANLSPIKAARELTRIEGELAAKPKATPSKAPEPISPVGVRGKASSSSLPSDEDDINTWMRKEQARMRGR